jgi:hypothetical protein
MAPPPWSRPPNVAPTFLGRWRLRFHVFDHDVRRRACVCGIQLAADRTSNGSVVPDAVATPQWPGAFDQLGTLMKVARTSSGFRRAARRTGALTNFVRDRSIPCLTQRLECSARRPRSADATRRGGIDWVCHMTIRVEPTLRLPQPPVLRADRIGIVGFQLVRSPALKEKAHPLESANSTTWSTVSRLGIWRTEAGNPRIKGPRPRRTPVHHPVSYAS